MTSAYLQLLFHSGERTVGLLFIIIILCLVLPLYDSSIDVMHRYEQDQNTI